MENLNRLKNINQSFMDSRSSAAAAADYNFGDFGSCRWPPSRYYTCNFCKREFRSAQALGGHMNVHRRDRARLRQMASTHQSSSSSSSFFSPNIYYNPITTFFNHPNPNFYFASVPVTNSTSILSSKQPNWPCSRFSADENIEGKNLEIVRWNFHEATLVGESKSHDDDHDLDLELRLGS